MRILNHHQFAVHITLSPARYTNKIQGEIDENYKDCHNTSSSVAEALPIVGKKSGSLGERFSAKMQNSGVLDENTLNMFLM
ncbi:hypothetical protein E3N88_15789 [Mikania micrantha]|uniref:Uncharacterized protein n=1 Tax=Mikania micrantha TaxID=192012 RepID=A0A5N6NWK5_9ASTR|nr:hypothetical protein E3N88_15789 [Mikania micrantha]